MQASNELRLHPVPVCCGRPLRRAARLRGRTGRRPFGPVRSHMLPVSRLCADDHRRCGQWCDRPTAGEMSERRRTSGQQQRSTGEQTEAVSMATATNTGPRHRQRPSLRSGARPGRCQLRMQCAAGLARQQGIRPPSARSRLVCGFALPPATGNRNTPCRRRGCAVSNTESRCGTWSR